jgi:pimeloyl-ACP methyl ester carboxylesterase
MTDPLLRQPWLPDGRIVRLPGRGETFARVHQHADPAAPTLLLLHGWTASADLQFFTAYEALAEHYSFVAIDHRGHGRGIRSPDHFTLEDAADDAAALVRELGITQVITVGYSMGGPISMLFAYRHRALVSAMVVEATALEWRATRMERLRWKTVRLIGPVLRSWAYPAWVTIGIRRLLGSNHELMPYVPWLEAEMHRGHTLAIVHAGRALGHYDARPWVASLDVPAAALITTRDRLVKPRKQHALARALGAVEVEVPGDHLVPWVSPGAFSDATLAAVDLVTDRSSSPV